MLNAAIIDLSDEFFKKAQPVSVVSTATTTATIATTSTASVVTNIVDSKDETLVLAEGVVKALSDNKITDVYVLADTYAKPEDIKKYKQAEAALMAKGLNVRAIVTPMDLTAQMEFDYNEMEGYVRKFKARAEMKEGGSSNSPSLSISVPGIEHFVEKFNNLNDLKSAVKHLGYVYRENLRKLSSVSDIDSVQLLSNVNHAITSVVSERVNLGTKSSGYANLPPQYLMLPTVAQVSSYARFFVFVRDNKLAQWMEIINLCLDKQKFFALYPQMLTGQTLACSSYSSMIQAQLKVMAADTNSTSCFAQVFAFFKKCSPENCCPSDSDNVVAAKSAGYQLLGNDAGNNWKA